MGPVDLLGRTFGRLSVVERAPSRMHTGYWRCVCSCGGESIVKTSSLLSGKTKSCGCLGAENRWKRSDAAYYRDPEFRSWVSMKSRCNYKNNTHWSCYGGRGIKVCDRWMDSYANFLADMGRKPSPFHSIDRIDVNGNYEPGNCRWATQIEQANNRRGLALIEWHGEIKTLTEWARCLGVTTSLLSSRRARGWSIERMMTQPTRITASNRAKHEQRMEPK